MSGSPFWFVNSELLVSFLRAEINAAAQLLTKHPDVAEFFDAPDATEAQRRACFELLTHHNLIVELGNAIVKRWEQPPSLSETEAGVLSQMNNLAPADAPEWAREMELVADQIPNHIVEALPEPLRTEGFYLADGTVIDAKQSFAETLGKLDRLQELVRRTIDRQWHRFARRRPTTPPEINDALPSPLIRQSRPPNKRKGWQQRLKLYDAIQKTLTGKPSLQGIRFCAELDKRHAPPLHDWIERKQWRPELTWKEAWDNSVLRRKIRRVRQEAMKRR